MAPLISSKRSNTNLRPLRAIAALALAAVLAAAGCSTSTAGPSKPTFDPTGFKLTSTGYTH